MAVISELVVLQQKLARPEHVIRTECVLQCKHLWPQIFRVQAVQVTLIVKNQGGVILNLGGGARI